MCVWTTPSSSGLAMSYPCHLSWCPEGFHLNSPASSAWPCTIRQKHENLLTLVPKENPSQFPFKLSPLYRLHITNDLDVQTLTVSREVSAHGPRKDILSQTTDFCLCVWDVCARCMCMCPSVCESAGATMPWCMMVVTGQLQSWSLLSNLLDTGSLWFATVCGSWTALWASKTSHASTCYISL